jgi:putative transposase
LADPVLAGLVVNSLLFFAGARYEVFAFVVMPSHFHWVFRPLESWVQALEPDRRKRTPRERIMHSTKRYFRSGMQRVPQRRGSFLASGIL